MRPYLKISDFSYPLPDERIAKYPLAERDASKLLIYKDGCVSEDTFRNIPHHLEGISLMVFNNTKVVPARMFFAKSTGACIEIFCLEPSDPSDYSLSFACSESCEWNCIVGNAKKWKPEQVLTLENPLADEVISRLDLKAQMVRREGANVVVRFSWKGGLSFSSVLEHCGKIPIPPYLNRESEESDTYRYQTLYAMHRGSVAAPTAGLHFTQNVLDEIDARGIIRENVCLHVGAGTFLPVKSEEVEAHKMHREPFSVSVRALEAIIDNLGSIAAVGTTSIRTLESLYYIGVRVLEGGSPDHVEQWEPYDREYDYTTREALEALLDYLKSNSLAALVASTEIIIVPGFRFRIVDRLVTNFHQPQSTLLLLISAFVGGDWKTIYDYALGNGFRFLSYGDSSLLYRADR